MHDTLHLADTTLHHPSDSVKVKKNANKGNLKSKVEYSSKDSLRFDIKEQKVLFSTKRISNTRTST